MYRRSSAPTTRVRATPVRDAADARALEETLRARARDGTVTLEAVDDARAAATYAFATLADAIEGARAIEASADASGRARRAGYATRVVPMDRRGGAVAARRADALAIPGLTLLEEHVSAAEEEALVSLARERGVETRLARRRVKHFGYAFDYGTREATEPCEAIPALAMEVLRRLPVDVLGREGAMRCDQVTVNEYPRGTGIAPHVDTHSAFGETIASLTLSGCAVMEFRTRGEENRALFLPRRSLLVMTGDARYRWQHYIPHRKSDDVEGVSTPRDEVRLSYTFRERRSGPCECAFPLQCDSRGGAESKCSKRNAGATQQYAELVGTKTDASA